MASALDLFVAVAFFGQNVAIDVISLPQDGPAISRLPAHSDSLGSKSVFDHALAMLQKSGKGHLVVGPLLAMMVVLLIEFKVFHMKKWRIYESAT